MGSLAVALGEAPPPATGAGAGAGADAGAGAGAGYGWIASTSTIVGVSVTSTVTAPPAGTRVDSVPVVLLSVRTTDVAVVAGPIGSAKPGTTMPLLVGAHTTYAPLVL